MTEKEIIVQGKTVKAARQLACKILKVEEEQIQAQILEEGKRSLWGLRKKPVLIRVIVSCLDKPNVPLGILKKEAKDGLAWVTGGNLETSTHTTGSGKRATIIPTEGVELKINGVHIKKAHELFPGDKVEIETVEQVTPSLIEIYISPDDLSASVSITPETNTTHVLVDQEPQLVLQLATITNVEKKEVDIKKIIATLEGRGVKYGINYQALEKAVAEADGHVVVVATGDPSIEGEDGYIEYLFPQELIPAKQDHEEKINYWEKFIYPSAQEGQILAIKHPPIKGAPGRKITGDIIQPREVQHAFFKIRDGVILNDDDTKAIAQIPGRPVLEGYSDPYLKIAPLMVHPGNVDMNSGNLHFPGDILVLGDINEGMQVVANGNITVMGITEGAQLIAGGSVFCRSKLINSQVKASGMQVLYNKLASQLGGFTELIDSLLQELNVLEEQLIFRRGLATDSDRRKLLLLLAARRKKEIASLVENYIIPLKEASIPLPSVIWNLPLGINNLINTSEKDVTPDPEELVLLKAKIEEIEKLLQSLPNQPGDIICSYVQSSTLEASGNIIVEGQGCFNSNIVAGRKINVWGTLRGGQVTALGGIFVVEVGMPGPSLGTTGMRVGASGKIRLNHVYPEVEIKIGQRSHVIDEPKSYVTVGLSGRGQIEITQNDPV
ncbi:MAG: flagellar assembly protein A [Bacillota bacterium]